MKGLRASESLAESKYVNCLIGNGASVWFKHWDKFHWNLYAVMIKRYCSNRCFLEYNKNNLYIAIISIRLSACKSVGLCDPKTDPHSWQTQPKSLSEIYGLSHAQLKSLPFE